MKKRTLTVVLGVWIALVPLLGLPNSWKNKLIVVSGILVVWAASGPSKITRQSTIRKAGVSSANTADIISTISDSESVSMIESTSATTPQVVATPTRTPRTRTPRATHTTTTISPSLPTSSPESAPVIHTKTEHLKTEPVSEISQESSDSQTPIQH